MKVRSLLNSSVVMVTGNAILSFVIWQIFAVDQTPSRPLPPALAGSAGVDPTPPLFSRIPRRSDSASTRLFGLPVENASVASSGEPARPREIALRLVGIILVEETGRERVALIEFGEPARVLRLRAGAELNPTGWRVQNISQSSIELTRGQERRLLKLD